ncbi:hypothetical protein COV18_02925 [Candidatus Woesearchaeota archaeon CG10_big_fil_rev_8_21_14_0_10_37_12]|nr:MAG: hypothetical protein COV18_02925 [Candidatus Woesearchaeota archaeon CG10_big_fil_rev_8_21_14_0_10_37_12]
MLQLKRFIGPKGQVVLPKDIRNQLNLQTGTEVMFKIEENKIVIELAADPKQYVEEFCAIGKNMKPITMKGLKKIQEEQYEQR